MSKKVTVEASELWDYFQKHKEKLVSSMHEVASNDEFGIVIYITEDEGLARIVVTADDEEVYDEEVISAKDCKDTAERIYDDYLTSNVIEILAGGKDDEDDSRFEIEDQIEEREAELEDALYMFLGAVCDDDSVEYYLEDELVQDVKEHFLEYLARKWGIPIRRPMFLEDEDGEEFFEEYPYEYMVFDDEDNPIYK